MPPVTPHPYNGLDYGHGLYGVDSIGTSNVINVVDDAVCPSPADTSILDEIFCSMKRFFDFFKIRRLAR